MNRENKFCVVALMEPFQNKGLIDRYRRRLNMETAYANINGQIWLFFDAVVEWELVEDTEQQVTVIVFHHDLGDFNVVLHEDEKIGGLPVHPPEYEDFAFCVNSCGLFEQGYKGSPFTCWSGRSNAECIFKRLDRSFVNFPFQNMLPTIEVEHLIRTGSDHAPLLMTRGVETFADIFKQLPILEDIVRVKEMLFEEEPATENRIVLQEAQCELKKYLSIEEQYWKQKAGMTWFAEGDRNTSFFHNHVNGKRKKLQLKRIKSGSGVWIEDQEQLATAAVDFCQK
ncbi:uncharacterized protein [Nicotiana tomentosiformis]|uniref:uncharacterized protein n=1 Tax=Nicotiana tomentosiformis TaxID=4098 RepID=UPI00388CE671